MKTEQVGQRIRAYMERQNISFDKLSALTGLDEKFLSTVIDDHVYPSLGPLVKIARALNVRLGTFLDDQISTDPVIVRHQGKREELNILRGEGKPVALKYYSLGSGKSDRHMEPFYIELLPEPEKEKDFSSHEGEEFFVVHAGQIEVIYGTETHILDAGDSIYYNSIVPHYVRCKGSSPASIYATIYVPR